MTRRRRRYTKRIHYHVLLTYKGWEGGTRRYLYEHTFHIRSILTLLRSLQTMFILQTAHHTSRSNRYGCRQ